MLDVVFADDGRFSECLSEHWPSREDWRPKSWAEALGV